jgi:hypothetical protein
MTYLLDTGWEQPLFFPLSDLAEIELGSGLEPCAKFESFV